MAASRDPLLTAAESGDVDKVRELLLQGRDVDCMALKTPLHYACEWLISLLVNVNR